MKKRYLLFPALLLSVLIINFFKYSPSEGIEVYLHSSDTVRVISDKDIAFIPVHTSLTRGIIFYPGGGVDAKAYAPIARGLAEKGYLVLIPSMPFNFSILDSKRASELISQWDDIKQWTLAGHSLGGVSAALFTESYSHKVDSLVLLAAYPSKNTDLSAYNIKVLSITAGEDYILNQREFEDAKARLPKETVFKEIKGGNHSGFGFYGHQRGDGSASISQSAQFEITVKEVYEFLTSEKRE